MLRREMLERNAARILTFLRAEGVGTAVFGGPYRKEASVRRLGKSGALLFASMYEPI